MKRWLLLLGGIVLILAGLGASALGAGLLSLFNDHDSVSTPAAKANGPGAALLIENIRIDASSIPLPHSLGTLTLSASSPKGTSVFLGAAPGDSVNTYLTGAPYDVVVDLTSGGQVTTRPVPGTQTPPPPTSQHIWSQQASGTNPSISALVERDSTVVVMNSDASNGVAADLVVSLQLPGARRAGWIAVGAGALLVLLGGVALWRSAVARRMTMAPAGAHAAGGAQVHPDSDAIQAAIPAETPQAVAEPATAEPAVTPEAVVEPATAEPATAEPPADPSLIPPWVHVEDSAQAGPSAESGPPADDSA
jgi:hypothetical protein